jgi:hypothetical protein
LVRLVRTPVGVVDLGEGVSEFAGNGVGGGDGVRVGLDCDGAVAAGSSDELLMLQPVVVSIQWLTARAADTLVRWASMESLYRPGLQVVLRRAERFLDAGQPTVSLDHELRGDQSRVSRS